jgi:hypothetical protein
MASCRWLSTLARPCARHGGFALMSVLALLALLLPLPPASLFATSGYAQANDDACAEDNSTYQKACLLPPNKATNSYLSSPDDEDYFRIEVLDFGVTVNLEMTQSPRPYRMTVQNWAGEPLAATVGLPNNDVERTLQFKPPAPGSYYLLVDALFGDADAVSPTEPYTLVYRPVYPGPIPKIAYAADFRQPSREFSGTKEWGNYSTAEGRYQVQLLKGGNGSTAAVAAAWWPDSYTDFTMVADVRLTAVGEQAGFAIGFRGQPHDPGEQLRDDQSDFRNAYMMLANTATLNMELFKIVDDKPELLVPRKPVRSMRTSDQINHVVVRAMGSQIIVNVNGEEVLNMTDPSLTDGRLILGALSFGEPVTVLYDNLLVTTPS